MLVGANPGIAQIELGTHLGIDKTSIVALLDRLEKCGLQRTVCGRRATGVTRASTSRTRGSECLEIPACRGTHAGNDAWPAVLRARNSICCCHSCGACRLSEPPGARAVEADSTETADMLNSIALISVGCNRRGCCAGSSAWTQRIVSGHLQARWRRIDRRLSGGHCHGILVGPTRHDPELRLLVITVSWED